MNSIVLLGSEQVERAAHRMADAAEKFNQAVGYMAEENRRHEQFMEEWLQRYREVVLSGGAG